MCLLHNLAVVCSENSGYNVKIATKKNDVTDWLTDWQQMCKGNGVLHNAKLHSVTCFI